MRAFLFRDNIKSLNTVTIHQIRLLSSCSNINPWLLDEINKKEDDRVYIRFPINEYSKKTKTLNAVEIIPIDIFPNCSEDDE